MKRLFTIGVAVLLSGLLALSVLADSRTRRDLADSRRPQNVNGFNINTYPLVDRSLMSDYRPPEVGDASAPQLHPLGSTSTDNGIGVGERIDITVHDYQVPQGSGRQIVHWYNGVTGMFAEVSVHFAYQDSWHIITDITGRQCPLYTYSGYNVYDATNGGDWPRGQDDGCELEATDPIGQGYTSSIDMMFNGQAVLASTSRVRLLQDDLIETYLTADQAMVYYQSGQYDCVYNPAESLNVSWVDSTVYRDNFIIPPGSRAGVYLRTPQVKTQFDGSNTIVHLLAGENAPPPNYGTFMSGDHFVTGETYWSWMYFQKVGDFDDAGIWSAGQTIDTIWFPWADLACAAYPNQGVAVVYTNPTIAAGTLENPADKDVWCRESFDRGDTWQPSYSITNYDNATNGSANHFTAWVESHCMFDSEGDLHAYWPAKPTSANPYHDNFIWNSRNANLYHWEKTNGQTTPGVGDIVKVANGNFMNDDMLSGSMSDKVCGFGGSNAGYLAFATMGECNGKLYMVWSQIHEKANRNDWQNAIIQPAPGILDDCSRTGVFGARANWELMMSVARLSTSSLWDYPRNITNTYTPNCGLPDDPAAEGVLCGSEWRSCLEEQALDETGLNLSWPPATKVDLSPGENYSGGWYLNMEYLDDVFPGPAYWGGAAYINPPPTENSEKWIRLACVEPIWASRIAVDPESIIWPEWVPLGTSEAHTVTVVNEGNVTLRVHYIGKTDVGWLDVSEHPDQIFPFEVPAEISNTRSFDIRISTAGLSQPTWLDGEVWLLSDAANDRDSISIPLHILAADTVEPVVWDTVMTHQNMLHPFLTPVGACVGLAVGNMGELGWGAGSDVRANLDSTNAPSWGFGSAGRVNLDYTDASAMPIARRECDTTVGRNRIYLVSSTPYVITANSSDGSGAKLSQVFRDRDQVDETGFDPTAAKGSLTGGLTAGGEYDSVYTGQFVNRDTSIAMERIVYGPRSTHPVDDTINFVIVYTKVYSADGLPHNHVTIGNAADWDVPSDNFSHNLGGVVADNFVYVQGTDTTGHNACASNVGRYATEVFGGGYTSAEFDADPCANNTAYKGASVINQLIMVDTSLWGSTPVTPAQPNPLVWWNTASVGGLSVVEPMPDTGRDLATFLTYKYDYNLGATETLNFWTVMTTTPIGGTVEELAAQVAYAKRWYTETMRGCVNPSCCVGRVGDANVSRGYPDEVTLGDIMLMVDAKFISGDCSKLTCIAEADVNQDGGATPNCDDHVTLGDIMILVDFLFITGPEVAVLKTCL